MGQRALGDVFAKVAETQQQEFLRLFNELFVRSYLQKLLLFRQPKFRVAGEEKRGDAVVVSTQVLVSDDAYAVDYEMLHEHDQWRAADVIVEGVSMTSNYRDQFAGLLRDRSFDDLLALMRSKLERFAEKNG
jgi:phospholipid transport system substrate-binding protein